MSSVVCLHEPHHWTKSIKIHTELHARVSVCAEADASGDLRKVRFGSFVLHASCFKSATVGKAQNVDDLYWVTLRRLGCVATRRVAARRRVERLRGHDAESFFFPRRAELRLSFRMESAYLCTPAALRDAEYRQSAFGALGCERETEVGVGGLV